MAAVCGVFMSNRITQFCSRYGVTTIKENFCTIHHHSTPCFFSAYLLLLWIFLALFFSCLVTFFTLVVFVAFWRFGQCFFAFVDIFCRGFVSSFVFVTYFPLLTTFLWLYQCFRRFFGFFLTLFLTDRITQFCMGELWVVCFFQQIALALFSNIFAALLDVFGAFYVSATSYSDFGALCDDFGAFCCFIIHLSETRTQHTVYP